MSRGTTPEIGLVVTFCQLLHFLGGFVGLVSLGAFLTSEGLGGVKWELGLICLLGLDNGISSAGNWI